MTQREALKIIRYRLMAKRAKVIDGYSYYAVSDDGRVFSFNPHGGWGIRGEVRVLKSAWNSTETGRLANLSEGGTGKQKVFGVHRLVLEAFVGIRPPGQECRHLDGNPENNRLENLCWGTPTENQGDRVRHGTTNRGERNGMSKLTRKQAEAIRKRRLAGEPLKAIAEDFGIHIATVCDIAKGRRWAA